MVTVKIFEKEYPIAYTVAAQSKIAQRFGGIEKIERAFDASDVAALMENMAFCASVMMDGYEDREAVRSEAVGNVYTRSITLTPEQISAAILPGEVKELSQAVMNAIQEGNKISVEVVPQRSKNGEATQ